VEFLSLHLLENTQIFLKIPDTSCTNLTPVLTNVTLLTTLFKDNFVKGRRKRIAITWFRTESDSIRKYS
jgi:hypothetical protein